MKRYTIFLTIACLAAFVAGYASKAAEIPECGMIGNDPEALCYRYEQSLRYDDE